MNGGFWSAAIYLLGFPLVLAAVAAGGTFAFRVGRIMVRDIVEDRSPSTRFDYVLPLQGRWLRLLVLSPLIATAVLMTFLTISSLLLFAAAVVGGTVIAILREAGLR